MRHAQKPVLQPGGAIPRRTGANIALGCCASSRRKRKGHRAVAAHVRQPGNYPLRTNQVVVRISPAGLEPVVPPALFENLIANTPPVDENRLVGRLRQLRECRIRPHRYVANEGEEFQLGDAVPHACSPIPHHHGWPPAGSLVNGLVRIVTDQSADAVGAKATCLILR